jgi:hypothetical protein
MANPGVDTAAGQSHTKVKRPGSACSTKTTVATGASGGTCLARRLDHYDDQTNNINQSIHDFAYERARTAAT